MAVVVMNVTSKAKFVFDYFEKKVKNYRNEQHSVYIFMDSYTSTASSDSVLFHPNISQNDITAVILILFSRTQL